MSLFLQKIILVVVSIIFAKLRYDKYKNIRFDKSDLQIE